MKSFLKSSVEQWDPPPTLEKQGVETQSQFSVITR